MRTLMTLATLATAVAGYFYLQQPLVSDQSQSEQPTLKKLFDWGKNSTNSPADRVPVAELTTRIRERTRSVLDEFVRQNGAPAEGLADNPFQRLQEASSATTSLSLQDKTSAAVKSWHDTRSQSSDLDELQRIAFDPTRTVRSRKSDDYLKTETSPPPQGVHELTDRLDHRIATGNVNGSAPVQSANSDHWQADVSRGIVPAGETQAPAVPAPATIIFAQTKESSSSAHSVPKMSQIRQREEATGQSSTDRVATGTTTPRREVAGTSSAWNVVGKTTEGRPMHSMHLGNQGIRTLVIAGLDGEDGVDAPAF